MRTKILAGNWKMNLSREEAKELILHLNTFVITHDQTSEVVIAPPHIYIHKATDILHNNQILISAQDVSAHTDGAYSGEISATMLKSMEVKYSIIGHSERRQFHYETDETLKQKANRLIEAGLSPIFCCGESNSQRERGITLQVISSQIRNSLFHLSEEEFSKVVIAYEPLWAIGTGKVAKPEEAQEVHAYIRNMIEEHYTKQIAYNTSILYGGSVKPNNAKEIFNQPDIDGGLIGGASLNSDDFTQLIKHLDASE